MSRDTGESRVGTAVSDVAVSSADGWTGAPLDVLQTITQIASAGTIEEVWSLTTNALATFGFDRVNYGFTRFRHFDSIGDPQDVLFLTNHSQEYFRRYFESGFFATTPMYRWVANNTGACSWTWAWEQRRAGKLSAQEIRALDENWEMGIRAGYAVSFADVSARAKGAMGLTARVEVSQQEVDEMWERNGAAILAICNTSHLKAVQMPYRAQRRPLTERQRQALEWVADGKTTQDIAILMDVSPAMVEKHLRLARDALDVETTAHAVAKAALMNQIFPVNQPGNL